MQSVGFIGLGAMGAPMAWNIHKAGYTLGVWNRNPARTQPFREAGIEVADSPRAVSQGKDAVVIMVSDPAALQEVLDGDAGVLAAVQPGVLIVNMSTVSPAATLEAAVQVESRGGRFIDAPVSGTVKPAEEGQLVVLAGARPGDVSVATPLLNTMGKAVVDCGDIGQGTRMKLVLNLLLGGMTSLLAEALALGRRFGLAPGLILKTLAGGPLGAPYYQLKGDMMIEGRFAKQFPIDLLVKDLGLVLDEAAANGLELPTTHAVDALFDRARERGLGDEDMAAVYKVLTGSA